MGDQKVNIALTKEHVIVFYEFLVRINKADDSSIFEDQAEQRVLWGIECILEKDLIQPFRTDYREILKNARKTVRDEKE